MSRKLNKPSQVRGPYSGCWEWTGSRERRGHGKTQIAGKDVRVHRAVYEALVGPIPEGMLVCHHCDNPPCFNPAHLFLGTPLDNSQDRVKKGRTTRRLDSEQVAYVRENYVPGVSRWSRGNKMELAEKFGVSPSTIYAAVNGVYYE